MVRSTLSFSFGLVALRARIQSDTSSRVFAHGAKHSPLFLFARRKNHKSYEFVCICIFKCEFKESFIALLRQFTFVISAGFLRSQGCSHFFEFILNMRLPKQNCHFSRLLFRALPIRQSPPRESYHFCSPGTYPKWCEALSSFSLCQTALRARITSSTSSYVFASSNANSKNLSLRF